jgi:hypothetical protein
VNPRVLSASDLGVMLKRSRRARGDAKGDYFVRAAVLSLDEATVEHVLWRSDLPDIEGGWRIEASATFVDPVGDRITPEAVAGCEGEDILRVEMLADSPSGIARTASSPRSSLDGDVQGDDIVEIRGRFAVVGSVRSPTFAHLSKIGAVAVNFVDLVPAADDRSRHFRMPDGRRVAGFSCIVGAQIPPILLRVLTGRMPAESAPTRCEVVVIPTVNANMLPNVPTVGEQRRRQGKSAPMPKVEDIVRTLQARRRVVGARVMLDDESMRLAAESARKRPTRRKHGLQLLLPHGGEAKSEAEIQDAVQAALANFDTDYLITFDAVTAVLGASPAGIGTVLDDNLRRRVVDMRFGSTAAANARQAERVALHFDTLCKVVVQVVPTDPKNTKVFRGRIIIPTGEVVDERDEDAPLKIGDVVMLNPSLYREMAKGKGVFLDPRYFRFDPYRQDWEMRLYRYLAARWSMSSVALQKKGDWTQTLRLADMLDMAGVDWRTKTKRGRGEGEMRRRVDAAFAGLQADGMIGEWRIDGDGLSDGAVLHVDVAQSLRDAIVGRRPGLHQAASTRDLARVEKPIRKQSRKD